MPDNRSTIPAQRVPVLNSDGLMSREWYNFFMLIANIVAIEAGPDGDRGDIVVSNGGTQLTIDTGVVSTAKMGGDVTALAKELLADETQADMLATLGAAGAGDLSAYLPKTGGVITGSLRVNHTLRSMGSLVLNRDGQAEDALITARADTGQSAGLRALIGGAVRALVAFDDTASELQITATDGDVTVTGDDDINLNATDLNLTVDGDLIINGETGKSNAGILVVGVGTMVFTAGILTGFTP